MKCELKKVQFAENKILKGEMHIDNLTQSFYLTNKKGFNIQKAMVWFSLLKDNYIPLKWSEPSHKGIIVKFKSTESETELSKSITKLESFVERKELMLHN